MNCPAPGQTRGLERGTHAASDVRRSVLETPNLETRNCLVMSSQTPATHITAACLHACHAEKSLFALRQNANNGSLAKGEWRGAKSEFAMPALFDQFKLRAEAVSAEVHRFPDPTAALQFIIHYLHDAGVTDSPDRYAVWAD